MSSNRQVALVAAARHGLPRTTPRPVEVDLGEWDWLLHVAGRDRLSGLMVAAALNGEIAIPDNNLEVLTEDWHAQLVACVHLETLLLVAADALSNAGIDWRLTKGPALAHLDYPDPSLRTFGDLDILIHPTSWEQAITCLAAAGWSREDAELANRFDDRFGKGVTLTNADDFEIDLHRRLAIGRFGLRLDTEALFDSGEHITLGGRRIPTLSGPHRLLHACFHAALGGFRELRAFRDVAQLLIVAEIDWEQTVQTATDFRVRAVVASAILEAWERLELELEHEALTWARTQRIGRLDAHALGVFGREESFRRQALTALPVLVGRGAIRYAWALTVKPGRRPRR